MTTQVTIVAGYVVPDKRLAVFHRNAAGASTLAATLGCNQNFQTIVYDGQDLVIGEIPAELVEITGKAT